MDQTVISKKDIASAPLHPYDCLPVELFAIYLDINLWFKRSILNAKFQYMHLCTFQYQQTTCLFLSKINIVRAKMMEIFLL